MKRLIICPAAEMKKKKRKHNLVLLDGAICCVFSHYVPFHAKLSPRAYIFLLKGVELFFPSAN